MNRWFRTVCLLILLFGSCRKRGVTKPEETPDLIFQKGIEYLKRGNYKEAERSFERIIYNYPTSVYLEDAQFYLAETYLKKGDYFSAKEEFNFFLKNFPASRYIEEANYKFILSAIRSLPKLSKDQEEILEIKEFIMEFKDKYPNSDYLPQIDSLLLEIANRLAKKEFSAGFLYYKAGEYDAAKVYFEYIIREFPETETAHEAEYLLGEICLRNGDKDGARKIFSGLLEKPLKEAILEKIRRYLREM